MLSVSKYHVLISNLIHLVKHFSEAHIQPQIGITVHGVKKKISF